MKLATTHLLSTTAIILASASTPAWAQATEPAPVAQETPAQPTEATNPTPEAETETIVVTGLRKSLQSAKNIKKNSDQVIDAIVAEDIGKLPDIAVSETAARIPGVQVTRRAGEADTVLVRGLPDFATTYNGREIFTAETRVVALQDFPSANIAALEVFKTTTANLVEAGMAGLVNVRSRKPFDFKGLEFAGSVWMLHTKQAGKWNPNVNLLLTDRWNIGDGGEIGALINYSRTELDYLDSTISNTDFVAPGPSGSRFPDVMRMTYGSGNRVRPSINGAIQYRPAPGLEFYLEGLWQGFRNKISDREFTQPLWGGASYTNLEFRDGTDLLDSGSVTRPFRGDGFQGGTFNKTDTYQFALGGSYDAGPLRLSADVARTISKFTGSTESVDFAVKDGGFGRCACTVNFDNTVPEFSFSNFDPEDPANYVFRGFYEQAQVSKGDDWQGRLDAEYDSSISFLPKLETGIRYSDRDAHREFGDRYANIEGQQIPISAVPLDYELFHSGFRGTNVQSGFTTYPSPTYSSIRDNIAELRQFMIDHGAGNYTLDTVAPRPTSTYDATEKTTAGYVQAHYQFGDTVDGVVGLRAVHTKTGVDGFSRVVTGPGPNDFQFVPVSASTSYTDWLPNASARIHFNRQLQLRLSATQTRTRPTFAQLNPSSDVGQPIGTCTPGGDPYACARVGGGGNPFLKPFNANNYDASLEYYFSPTGFVAAGVFRRDLKGFIQNRELRYIDPELGPLILNSPVNTNKARIDGAELQASTFFDWNWVPPFLRSFGAQANLTYIDTKVDDPISPDIQSRRIYGVSKWTYNLVGMYEHGPLSARLSWFKRSKTLETIQNRGNDIYIETAKPSPRLDFSANYRFGERFGVFFDWTNILGDPHRQYMSSARDGAPRSDWIRYLRFEETVLSGGVRFSFGH